ncbi:MAG: hypothetical protein OIF58_10685, partial [Cohaesibacter sp.]|nr:hypothetical protein [Cohaesibacter sp.]
MADRETFEAALKCNLRKRGMAESFLKLKQRAALEALVRDKRDLLAIIFANWIREVADLSASSRCIQCH